MKVKYTRGPLGVALWSLVSLPAFGQQEVYQLPGASSPALPASVSSCAQSSQGVTRSIDVLNARIEEARQTNDPAKMRAAVADLQVGLAQIKTQLADCTGPTQAGRSAMGTMAGMDQSRMQMAPASAVKQPGSPSQAPGAASGSAMAGMDHSKMAGMDSKTPGTNQPRTSDAGHSQMAGMDHSKMQAAPKSAKPSGSGASAKGAKAAAIDHSKMAGAPSAKTTPAEPSKTAGMDHSKMAGQKAAPAAAASKAGQAPAVVFTLRTDPAPPRSGKNDLEVSVKDADGKPIADAEVSLVLYMPPMPSMNMPGTRKTVKLTSTGNGIHKGSVTIGMAGDWDVTVTASRNGQQLDAKRMKLTAK